MGNCSINLLLRILETSSRSFRSQKILDWVYKSNSPGLVYVLSRIILGDKFWSHDLLRADLVNPDLAALLCDESDTLGVFS